MVANKKLWPGREAAAVTVVVGALLAIGSEAAGTVVLYVDADAPPGGNGLSWATAFQNPHQAYEVANPPPGGGAATLTQIWVAEGTYLPTLVLGGDPEETSFFLTKNLEYLGGFAGTETGVEQRDPEAHVTILSGDVGVPDVVTDNSRRIVRAGSTADATAVLDGFTITGGYADIDFERGGGLFCEGGNPTVRRCRFVDNYALRKGGAVYTNGPATFIECEFIDNAVSLERGGGIASDSSTIAVLDCHFEGNAANTGGGLYGGGLVENCTFVGNSASSSAGGAFSWGTIRNCTFADNTTTFNGGGGLNSDSGVPLKLSNCLFINNSGGGARGGGARIGSATGQATIANCIFLGNAATAEGGGLWSSATSSTVINCLFSGNSASLGGGVAGGAVNLRNCSIGHNTASASTGGGLWTDVVASVRNSVLWGNTAAGGSGYSAQISMFSGSTIQWSCIQGWTGAIGGTGNIGADPDWLNPLGPDLIAGTDDDNLRVAVGSPCIDSAQNSSVPPDALDLDSDGNTVEPVPVDLDNDERFFDDIKTPDTGSGIAPLVDMGAYEFDGDRPETGPGTYVGPPGGSWFEPTHWAGGSVPNEGTDVFIDNAVVIAQAGAAAATVTLLAGGSLTLQGGTLDTDAITIAAGASLILSGAAAVLEADLLSVQTGGSLQWNAGTIQIHQSFASAANVTIGCSGTALFHLVGNPLVTAPSITICSLGELRGTGVVNASLTNGGLVSPGAPIGTLTINGPYVQNAAGDLAMVIGGYVAGDQTSFLVVNGAATLDGALAAVTLPTFQHELAGINQLVVAGSIAGQFDLTDLPDLPGLFLFQAQSSETSVSLFTTLSSTGPRLHVDDDAAAGGDGQTWATAVRGLNGALAVQATFPDLVEEVWVAAGTYRPTQRTDPLDPRSVTFTIPDAITLIGGFAGGESAADQADPVANPTILDGDLLGNDVPGPPWDNPTLNDNSYHLLITSDSGPSTIVNGFAIRSGNANGPGLHSKGGGILNVNGDVTISNCVLLRNRSLLDGAGMYNELADPTLLNCTFQENLGTGNPAGLHCRGAGIFNLDSQPTLLNCQFIANIIYYGESTALHMINSSPTVTDCSIINHENRAVTAQGGGGTWTGCVFDGNHNGSAPALFLNDSDAMFSNCSFTNNFTGFASGDGGAIRVNDSGVFSDCLFANNTAGGAGGAVIVGSSDFPEVPQFVNCVFQGNQSARGGAVYVNGPSPTSFLGCQFLNNVASLDGGGAATDFGTVTFEQCTFSGNLAGATGGGYYRFGSDGTSAFINTTFNGNIAPQGSGLYIRRGILAGDATLAGGNSIVNGGELRPGLPSPGQFIGLYNVSGDYLQTLFSETGDSPPRMVFDIEGPIAGIGHDALHVDGTVELDAGSLIVNLMPGFTPQLGDSFDLITANRISGAFTGIGTGGLPAGLAFEAEYLVDRVRVTVVEGRAPVFSDPHATVILGSPTDAAPFDFNHDGFNELALTIDESGGPGSLYVLMNGGVESGEWVGFADTPVTVDVGNEPTDVAAGDLNDDKFDDLVVVRGTNNLITIVPNFGGTLLLPTQTYFASGLLSDIVVGQLTGSAAADFAVPMETASAIRVYENQGDATFLLDATLPAGTSPNHLALSDIDLDGDNDLVAANTSDLFLQSKLSVHLAGPSGFAGAVYYPIGRQTTGLVVATFNGDAWPDAITANRLDQSLSVLMADPRSPGTFLDTYEIPLGGDPFGMVSSDFDADGDRDLLVIVKPPGVPTDLRPVRNDVGPTGESIFVVLDPLETKDPPSLIAVADVDSDGDEDLILGESVTSGVAGTPEIQTQIVVYLTGDPDNPADLNMDGVVNGFDLAILLAAWGPCPLSAPCPADLNENGAVNGFDLAILLGSWS